MAQINLKQLEAFVQVADLGSFRRAAEKLGTTQPNISARIAGLENHIGAKLMTRDAGSIRLTLLGDVLLPKARQVLHSMEDFMVTAGEDLLFDGVLRLGVTEMVVHSWLGAYLTALRHRFPNIDVDLTVDLSANLSGALQMRAIDLALQSGPFAKPTSETIDLGSFPFVWVASSSLKLPPSHLSLSELAAHSILTHAKGTLPYEQVNDHLAASAAVPVRLVPSTNMAACIQMTREGLGVACLPKVMVNEDVATGRLVQLAYPWHPDPLLFYARYDGDTAAHFVVEAAQLAAYTARLHNHEE